MKTAGPATSPLCYAHVTLRFKQFQLSSWMPRARLQSRLSLQHYHGPTLPWLSWTCFRLEVCPGKGRQLLSISQPLNFLSMFLARCMAPGKWGGKGWG